MPEIDPERELKLAWQEFRRGIDERLDAYRPERVGSGEREWRERVYGWARNHIPDEEQLVRRFAENEVDRREGVATKAGNKLLREWMHGRMPLSWELVGPKPIVVDGLRIRLDVATPKDMEDAARELRAGARQTYEEVTGLAMAMEGLARQARRRGFLTVRQLGDLPPMEGQEAA